MKNKKNVSPYFLIGASIMSSLDEIIFHQLLDWHHFYDRSSRKAGLISDGILHAIGLTTLLFGFSQLVDKKKKNKKAASDILLGLGAFQLFDGLVNHKIFKLHQVRYVKKLLPYDIAWNLTGIILLVTGFILRNKENDF